MKREELKNLGLTDEQIKFVMDENGKDINALKATMDQKDQEIKTLTTERDGLKKQVADRDTDIADLKKQAGNTDELNKKLGDLQAKYDNDTKDLQTKLDSQARTHATEKFYGDVEFTSAFAKKAAIAEFEAANLEFKDGVYVGADDFLKGQREKNPDAFKVVEPPKDPEPKPKFGDPNPAPPKNKPKFSLAEMMQKKNENPNATINFE